MKDKKIQIARHLRQEQTPAETALWELLRNRKFKNLKFRRQHPLKEYIVDFFCDELELVIELDGAYHLEKEQAFKDEQRDFLLSSLGYRILRYRNDIVFNDIERIFSDIEVIQSQTKSHLKKAQIKKSNSKNKYASAPFSVGEELGMRESKISNQSNQLKILSTKKLKPNQRDLLLGAGFSVVDYDAIDIEFLDFKIPSEIKNVIFTSQNGVTSYLKQISLLPSSSEEKELGMRIEKVFCVGKKTKALLEQNGLKVTKTTDYGAELGDFIAKNYKNDSFHFFCGTNRREEIPTALKAAKIEYIEVKTYKTTLKPLKFDQKWDGILFFSPSGVESFAEGNSLQDIAKVEDPRIGLNTVAFCIGTSTAQAAKNYFKNVVIANTTLIESVIAKAVKTLK